MCLEHASGSIPEGYPHPERQRDPLSLSFVPIPAASSDDAVCKLFLIRQGQSRQVPASAFVYGKPEDERINVPCFCFLIEKKQQDGSVTRITYDLGLRNPEDFKFGRAGEFAKAWDFVANGQGVPEILEANNVPLSTLNSAFIGHTHLDHIGDISKLPENVEIVVGSDAVKGKELAEDLQVDEAVVNARTIRYLPEQGSRWKQVGSLSGLDYFGDGSLWFLDTPGHKAGHTTALVRTSTQPELYYLLAGDTCHDIALLPKGSSHAVVAGNVPGFDQPTTIHENLSDAYESIAKISRMDMEPNVNVILAHDPTVDVALPKGSYLQLDGGIDELNKLKKRDRTARIPLGELRYQQ